MPTKKLFEGIRTTLSAVRWSPKVAPIPPSLKSSIDVRLLYERLDKMATTPIATMKKKTKKSAEKSEKPINPQIDSAKAKRESRIKLLKEEYGRLSSVCKTTEEEIRQAISKYNRCFNSVSASPAKSDDATHKYSRGLVEQRYRMQLWMNAGRALTRRMGKVSARVNKLMPSPTPKEKASKEYSDYAEDPIAFDPDQNDYLHYKGLAEKAEKRYRQRTGQPPIPVSRPQKYKRFSIGDQNEVPPQPPRARWEVLPELDMYTNNPAIFIDAGAPVAVEAAPPMPEAIGEEAEGLYFDEDDEDDDE